MKKNRIPRNKTDIQQELKDQIVLLKHACSSYDNGLEALGKHIALILRVLFHHHGSSRSLLEQLNLRDNRFFDSAGPLNPQNKISEFPLVVAQVSKGEVRYIAACQAGSSPFQPRRIKFVDWWNEPILKDLKGKKFCRRELIQNVADTDGGAHVDPELEEAYMNLSRNNSLGWMFTIGDIQEKFKGKPELACIRQIAYETLLSIQEIAPEYM